MESDQLEELVNEFSKVQDSLTELCPDIEKIEPHISSYPELAIILASQNREMVEKIRQLRESCADSDELVRLQAENQALSQALEDEKRIGEKYEKHIEALAKELDIYKSKSSGDVQRKIAALDTKAKAEAKALKLENEHLKEILNFKDTKVVELQQEIDRLKIILRIDTASARKMPTPQTMSKLEQRLDEAAETGKIEYRILLPPEDDLTALAKERSLEKILNIPPASLSKILLTQSKMLECQLQESGREVEEKFKAKFEEVTTERNELENAINHVLELEKTLQQKFDKLSENAPMKGKILKVKEEWKASLKYSSSEDERVGLSDSPIHFSKERDEDVDLRRSDLEEIQEDFAEPVELKEKPRKDSVDRCIAEGQLVKAAELLKAGNYELANENVEEVVQKLRLVCKVQDKQIEKLKKEVQDAEVAELAEEEITDIINDYETMKEKYNIEFVNESKELNQRLESLQSELIKKAQVNSSLAEQLEKAKEKIKEQEDQISKLEQYTTSKTQASPRKTFAFGKTLEKPIGQYMSDTLKEECDKNREIIQELMETKTTGTQGKANKLLYEQTVELHNKVRGLSEELDGVKELLEDLSAEHIVAVSKLEQMLNRKETVIKSPMAKSSAKRRDACEYLVNETQMARKISILINEISLSDKEVVLDAEKLRAYQRQVEETKTPANEIYKAFFVEERVYPMSVDSLLDRMKHKNSRFKDLFKLCEKLIAINDALIASKAMPPTPSSIRKPAFSPQRSSLTSPKEQSNEQADTINKLFAEVKGLKELVSAKKSPIGAKTTESPWKDKMEALEAEVQLANSQLKECTEELDKRMDTILAKDKEIQNLKVENRGLLEKNRQLNYSQSLLESELAQIRGPRGVRTSPTVSFQNEAVHLRKELFDAQELNNLLEDKVKELSEKLEYKDSECTRLDAENAQLLEEVEKYKKMLEETTQEKSEVHKMLNENMFEYKKGYMGYKEEVQFLKEKLREKEGSVKKADQLTRLIEKIKTLKQEGSFSAKYSSSDYYTATLILDDVKEQLQNNKKLIESLQAAVNTLQGERQMFSKVLSPTSVKPFTPVSKAKTTPETRLESNEKVLKNSVQRYESWLDSIQEPVKKIGKAVEQEYGVGLEFDLRKPKIDIREIREVIIRGSDLLEKIRGELRKKIAEVTELKTNIKKSKEPSHELMIKVTELESTLEKVKRDKFHLESILEKQKTESAKLYEKGTFVFLNSVVKEDVLEAENEKLAKRLERAREEGILIGQKQQRMSQSEELEKMTNLLKTYREELDTHKAAIEELTAKKRDLEQYNKKANEEILVLVRTLKSEQEKQKQLSEDLEALTSELKIHRVNKSTYEY